MKPGKKMSGLCWCGELWEVAREERGVKWPKWSSLSPSAALSRLAQAGKGRLVTSEGWGGYSWTDPLYGPWMRQSCMWEIPRQAQGPSLPPIQAGQPDREEDAEMQKPQALLLLRARQKVSKTSKGPLGAEAWNESRSARVHARLWPDEIDHRSHPPKSATNTHRASSPSGWDNSPGGPGRQLCLRTSPPPTTLRL